MKKMRQGKYALVYVDRNESQMRQIVRRLANNKGAMIALGMLVVMVILSALASFIIPYAYDKMDFSVAYLGPSFAHPFGCDDLGRDILSRVIYGARYSLAIGVCSVLLAVLMGCVIGSVAGYFGGWLDNILMRLLDILSALPSMLMAIVISAVLGTGFDKCFLAIAVSTMPQYARILRSQIMSLRSMEYLEAAVSINCSSLRIIVKHIIPNAFSAVLVAATMNVGSAILMAAGLSYIGLGIQPPTPEWGAMLSTARGFMRDYPHMMIFPGLAIMITVLCLNIFGDGLRDAMDPKLKR